MKEKVKTKISPQNADKYKKEREEKEKRDKIDEVNRKAKKTKEEELAEKLTYNDLVPFINQSTCGKGSFFQSECEPPLNKKGMYIKHDNSEEEADLKNWTIDKTVPFLDEDVKKTLVKNLWTSGPLPSDAEIVKRIKTFRKEFGDGTKYKLQ